ncbi:hypothetical protein CCUS01_04150 [Colletotrichum cuscutae]|uniref:Uncharacterized protein n=2 Tax=Colletotrichum acutatum species complex TaxID=2707335 RepID=A0AAI9Y3V8_9PEZI|nr:hypothetical protein CCUS01_04150 [Colletotrichum cuscutae]
MAPTTLPHPHPRPGSLHASWRDPLWAIATTA